MKQVNFEIIISADFSKMADTWGDRSDVSICYIAGNVLHELRFNIGSDKYAFIASSGIFYQSDEAIKTIEKASDDFSLLFFSDEISRYRFEKIMKGEKA